MHHCLGGPFHHCLFVYMLYFHSEGVAQEGDMELLRVLLKEGKAMGAKNFNISENCKLDFNLTKTR